jgi:enoyl-CoA hydratase/carnithine racemase
MSAIYDRLNETAILWMAYSADFIDAHTAQNFGIISQVIPEAKLNEAVDRFCQKLLSRPRASYLRLKEYMRRSATDG